MRTSIKPLLAFSALAATCLLSGCGQLSQLKALLTRPSAHMPARPEVAVTIPGQNWTADQREWFYHAGQGSELMPYKWFLAIEQPKIKLIGTPGRFSDPDYLAGFGFFKSPAGPYNPDGLPVGFTKETITDPHTGEALEIAGLSCAACHTGQIEYQGKGVRIDGGTASADPVAFQSELGVAVALTDMVPFRFDRFARNVLGPNASSDDKKKLHDEFKTFLAAGIAENDMATAQKLYSVQGGFGRTDALARIGNYVFGTELDNANLRQAKAPVKLPPIWYTSWFARVQYNYSIQQPMTRNVGEALGVRARVNLIDPAKLYQSTVNVTNLWKMETQLAGPTAWSGLKAPVWPADILGPIDQEKAHKGAAVYKQMCERCHLPSVNSPEIQDAKYWEAGQENHRFLKLNVSSLDEIGTDPHQAADFAARTAVTGPAMGLGTVGAAAGLNTVTVKVRDVQYDKLGLTPEQRIEWNGYRVDDASATLGYRARPLEGIWATPPFLHNGSVPNLYELLLPVGQRSKTFYTGSREFDPKRIGYSTAPLDHGFEFNTDQTNGANPGNSNAGHEFSNTPGKGVIGPELTDEQRWEIIEYLKSMGSSDLTASAAPAGPEKTAKW
jgi:mono/diheme cytochrome c family protein